MGSKKWDILTQSDEALVKNLIALSKAFSGGSYTFVLMDEGASQPLKGSLVDLEQGNPFRQSSGDATIIISSASLQFPAVGGGPVNLNVARGQGIDTLSLRVPDATPPEQLIPIVQSVRRAFRKYERAADLDAVLPPALADFYRRREETLTKLESFQTRLTEQTVDHRKALDEESERHRAKLEAGFEERRRDLEGIAAAKTDELNNKQSALDREKASIDASRSTHARRRLREDLLTKLRDRNEKFALSADTGKKRVPVHLAFVSLLIAAGASLGLSLYESVGDATWQVALRLGLSAIAFAAAAVFYIRWNDQWARSHAEEEFRAKRMELDVDRASWVVEMLLEWKEEKEGAALPKELIEALTTGLFDDDRRAKQRTRHPVEDLATALLGASSTVELGVGGSRVVLDRKGIDRLAKSGS